MVGPRLVAIATAIALPIGVLIALFLTEYASSRLEDRCGSSTCYGILDHPRPLRFNLLINQSTVGFAARALAIIELPLIARGTQEVLLRSRTLREASTRSASPAGARSFPWSSPGAGGIATATVLAVARAAGRPPHDLAARSSTAKSRSTLQRCPTSLFIYKLSEEENPEGFTGWDALALVSFILFASLGARALLARSKRNSPRHDADHPQGQPPVRPGPVRAAATPPESAGDRGSVPAEQRLRACFDGDTSHGAKRALAGVSCGSAAARSRR